MRVMVFMKAADGSDKGSPEAFAAMDRFTEELVEAGVFVAAAGLKNTDAAKRVTFEGESQTIAEGPFVPARDLIMGFSIWQVKDMDEAMAWVKRCPNPTGGRSEVEIRPFYEVEDLAEFLTPEERAAPPRDGERGKLGVA